MAPRIVSLNEVKTSPVVLSQGTSFVVPIESLSNSYTKPPIIPDASKIRTTLGARLASFLGVAGESETPDGSCQQSDDSFTQHHKYFFKDGNVTFLVDGFLYRVHQYFFSRDSTYFSTRFARLEVRGYEVSSTIVSLGNVECKDFEAFLSVLYPENFDEHDLSYEQWRSVLHLSALWGFDSLRSLALKSIDPPTAYDRLLLARTYSVDHWITSALTALCKRAAPLSLDEAREMTVEDLVLVATVREHIRNGTIQFGVSSSEISRRVEAMQAGTLGPAVDEEASPKSLASEVPEPCPPFNCACGQAYEGGVRVVESPRGEPVKEKASMSGWNGVKHKR